MSDYFNAPSICQSKSGGIYNYVCEYHARQTGGVSVCLFKKKWSHIFPGFNCPNKDWKKNRRQI
jgi:hypothetical protein